MHAHASLSGEKRELREIRFRVSRYVLIDVSTFSGFLRQKRLEKGLTQEKLAKIIKVTTQSIRNWEKKRSLPSKELLERIYDILS